MMSASRKTLPSLSSKTLLALFLLSNLNSQFILGDVLTSNECNLQRINSLHILDGHIEHQSVITLGCVIQRVCCTQGGECQMK